MQPMIVAKELVTDKFELNRTKLHFHREISFSDFKRIAEEQAKKSLDKNEKLLVCVEHDRDTEAST